MRTTIEIRRSTAQSSSSSLPRGSKGFSDLVGEALETYLNAEADRATQRKRAVLLKGALAAREAQELRKATEAVRRTWR